MSWAWAVVLAIAAALVWAAPASATATNLEREVEVGFTLKGSNGYELLVLGGSARADGAGSIEILVHRGRAVARYGVPATVTEGSIEADFGAFGRIDVQLVKSGERRTGRCAGKPAPYQPASYVGTVEFHGENGYTDVSASTVAIEYPALFRLFCGLVSVGELTTSGVGLPGAALTVGGRGREAPLHIDAHKNKKAGRTWLSASESETREGIAISRSVSVVAGPDAFEYDPTLRWATLSPPAPFSGTGAFHRGAAKANRWTGDLSVDFPGDPGASLTAPGLGVRLVHSEYSQHRS